MLNCFVVEGYVSSDVNMVLDNVKKTHKTTFHVDNVQKTGKNSHNNKFYVVVYGKLAERCAHSLTKGMRVKIQGPINTWSKIEGDCDKSGVVISASNVYWD